ncbi:DUF3800 domain-containing protein [Candidatus Woesearchaeota archaeon]|nr:DUF3800 domain-containing protein [Candidatus Woesearchaeota archaeon]
MEFAYLDESGDLGPNGSRNLVLTLMCTRKKKEISRVIRDAKKRLLDHNKTARWLSRKGEIKFYSFPDKDLLKRTLRKLADIEMNVYFIFFEKDGTAINADIKQTILTHLFRHIMKKPDRTIDKVIADLSFFNKEKLNRFILQSYTSKPVKLKNDKGLEFDAEYGKVTFSRLSAEEFEKAKDDISNTIVEIEHYNSRLSDELQALDLISGSIFAFVEHGNKEYFDLISKSKVKIDGVKFQ